jgi:hypothetical protein
MFLFPGSSAITHAKTGVTNPGLSVKPNTDRTHARVNH